MKHRTAMLASLLASIPGAAWVNIPGAGQSEVRAPSAAQERQAPVPNQAATTSKAARMTARPFVNLRPNNTLGLVKGKPGAAALKRAAKKRANVRARSPMARKGKG